MIVQRTVTGVGRLFSFATAFQFFFLAVVFAQTSLEVTVYVDRAVLAYTEKRYQDALKELEAALRVNPESVDALYYQGVVYLALNEPANAQAALEKARQLRPGDVDVAFQLGILYFNQQNYEKAEPLLREAHQADPRRQNLGYYLGFIEYLKGNHRRAVDLFRANVPSDDAFAQLSRFYAGLAIGALGFAREARAEIEEALRLQPASPLTSPAGRFGEVLGRADERERSFRGELRLGIFYDTNVPVVPHPSADSATQSARQEHRIRQSEGELASLNLAYTWLRTLDWEGTISHRFLQTYNNHLTEFNTQSQTPTFSLIRKGVMPSAFGDLPYIGGTQLTYDFTTLGNARFIQRWILSPYFTLVESPRNVTTLQFRFQWKDFFDDKNVVRQEIRDAKNYMIGPLHVFLFDQGRHFLKVGYQYDVELAEGKNWEYWGNRLLLGGQSTLPFWGIRLKYDLDYHWRFHKHKHSLLPATAVNTKRRRDREPVHLVGAAKDFQYGSQNFTFSLDYLFDNNNSNLKSFDYDRHVVTTSITWRF